MSITLITKKISFNELSFKKIYTYAFDLRPNLYLVLERNGFVREKKNNVNTKFKNSDKKVVVHSIINNLSLRKVSIKDLEITFKWANNKKIRKYSLNKNAISISEHELWFTRKLTERNCKYYILVNSLNTSIGSVRIDNKDANEWIISYLIDPKFHRNNYGFILLELLEKKITSIKNTEKKKLIGLVKSSNIASLKIFRKLNYKEILKRNIYTFSKLV